MPFSDAALFSMLWANWIQLLCSLLPGGRSFLYTSFQIFVFYKGYLCPASMTMLLQVASLEASATSPECKIVNIFA